jgi:hypothetical protein
MTAETGSELEALDRLKVSLMPMIAHDQLIGTFELIFLISGQWIQRA